MKSPIFMVGLLLAAATSSSVFAATVHNMDTAPQTVSVMENGTTSAMTLAASASKTYVCTKGCDLSLGTHKLSLKGTETVNIKGGDLVIQN